MNHITFDFGKEEHFLKFIKKMSLKKDLILISHNDLDGISSAKIIDLCLMPQSIKFIEYNNLNYQLVNELRAQKVKQVIFSDLKINNSSLIKDIEKFADVLIIDHHPSLTDLNSQNTVFINSKKFCTTYICYYLLSKLSNLDNFRWLVACAALADWVFNDNKEFMSDVYSNYGESFETGELAIKKGKFWEAQYTLSLALVYFNTDIKRVYNSIGENFKGVKELEVYSKRVFVEINSCLERFKIEKTKFKEGYFWEFSSPFPIRAVLSNTIAAAFQDKIIILAEQKNNFIFFTIRSPDKSLNADELSQKLIFRFTGAAAGGHPTAAAGFFSLKDKEKFVERIKEI